MSQFLVMLSLWLHSLATVVFIGYPVLMALIYLPALQDGPQEGRGALLSAISKRSRNWLYLALVVFAVTGTYLTLVDPGYLGLARFNNPWTILMLVKHTVILVMIGIGFWYNAILRVGPLASSNSGAAIAMRRFRTYVYSMAASGTAVLLLTALAQGQ